MTSPTVTDEQLDRYFTASPWLSLLDYLREQNGGVLGAQLEAVERRYLESRVWAAAYHRVRKHGVKITDIRQFGAPLDLAKLIAVAHGVNEHARPFWLAGVTHCDAGRIVAAINALDNESASVLAYHYLHGSDLATLKKFLPAKYIDGQGGIDTALIAADFKAIRQSLAAIVDEVVAMEAGVGHTVSVSQGTEDGSALTEHRYTGGKLGEETLVATECAINDAGIRIKLGKYGSTDNVARLHNGLTGRDLVLKDRKGGKNRTMHSGDSLWLTGADMTATWDLAVREAA